MSRNTRLDQVIHRRDDLSDRGPKLIVDELEEAGAQPGEIFSDQVMLITTRLVFLVIETMDQDVDFRSAV
ncbi:hypothetical protein [Microvirga massiliensis]|uniref:hypothetical protein n=1 Tax=Microvirga massiliensis TaxID=1033741 RepID=UPI00062BD09F|nr:hypothetical protein [Microvirga massiliensis]